MINRGYESFIKVSNKCRKIKANIIAFLKEGNYEGGRIDLAYKVLSFDGRRLDTSPTNVRYFNIVLSVLGLEGYVNVEESGKHMKFSLTEKGRLCESG